MLLSHYMGNSDTFDQALALWDRVTEPEKLAGMQRGWLAFESAPSAAASGDLHRAVQQLHRMLEYITTAEDPVLVVGDDDRRGGRGRVQVLRRRPDRGTEQARSVRARAGHEPRLPALQLHRP